MNERIKPNLTNGMENPLDQVQKITPGQNTPTITNIAPLFKPQSKKALQESLHQAIPEDVQMRFKVLKKGALNGHLWTGVTAQPKDSNKK